MNPAVRTAVAELINFFNEADAAHTAERYPNLKPSVYELEGGRKYLKIALVHDGGAGQRLVHCFVDSQTGDVYKAASWKAPALNGARYNILNAASLEELHRRFDPYGAYLYK